MRPKMRPTKVQEERDRPPAPSMKTQLRLKKTRKLGLIDLRAKKRILQRRMRSIANTRQGKEINLKVAVKVEKRVEGQKAERRVTSTKMMTGEVVQRAKTEMLTRKRRSLNLITAKIDIRAMSLTKSIKRTQKEEMQRDLEQHQKARKEQLQKTGVDQAADTGIEAEMQHRKTKKKNEKKTARGSENIAGVRRDDATVKGRIRGVEHPGIRNIEQEVQTEIRLETRIEAGVLEVRVIRETTAKNDHLTEETKTEELPTKEDAAAALKATKARKGRIKRAQIPKGEQRVPPNPKTEKAQPDPDQIVQRAKTGTTARGINRVLAPALTVTEPVIS